MELRGRSVRGAVGRCGAPAALLIAVTFGAAAAIRAWFVAGDRPAFLGNADSATYAWAAAHDLFHSPVRPAGYPLFLRILHEVSPHLTYTIVLQHVIGLATGALLYSLLRRVGVSPWLAIAAAGVVLFDGLQVFLEHSLMSDSVFEFLVVAALYAVVRSSEAASARWLTLAGALLGLSATIRTLGIFLVAALAGWLLLQPGPWRARASRALRGGGVGTAVVVAYLVAQWSATGVLGLTQADGYNLYSRVATFADCHRFHPPTGTRILCEATPPAGRPGGNFYEWEPASPANRAFGGMPHGAARLAAFSRAAIVHQPLDYVRAVGRDVYRYLDPGAFYRRGANGGPDDVIRYGRTGDEGHVEPLVAAYWSSTGFARADIDGLVGYATTAELPGGVLLCLLLLSAAAPIVARGRARRLVALLVTVAVILLVVPVVALVYDGRYTLPAYAPLVAGAAIAVQALADRLRARAVGAGRDPAPEGAT